MICRMPLSADGMEILLRRINPELQLYPLQIPAPKMLCFFKLRDLAFALNSCSIGPDPIITVEKLPKAEASISPGVKMA